MHSVTLTDGTPHVARELEAVGQVLEEVFSDKVRTVGPAMPCSGQAGAS
jgi:hypothetical protein